MFKLINIRCRGIGLLFAILLLPSSYAFTQDLSKRITIIAHEIPLEDVIQEIEQKANVYFSYSPQEIPAQLAVSVEAKNKSVKYILRKVFRKNGIKYKLVGDHIVLKTSGEEFDPEYLNEGDENKQYTISGYLKDRASGEVLIGAHVYDKDSYTGTSTNAYGFYSLTLPAGVHSIVFSFLGYEASEINLLLDRDKKLNHDMKESLLMMKEVEIVGRTDKPYFLNTQISEFHFSNKTLSKLPGITGDKDIIKSLQVVPGVESFGDGSSLFFVRGGSSDQNLILVDEVPMYNTSHLFGFLSVISPDAISNIEVFKGDFPVKYGNRLSSVVDIKTKDGNMKRFGFGGNVGPYTNSISIEGPIIKDKSSFYVGGRLSTIQWLANLYFKDQDIQIGFFDLNLKFNFKINDNNRLFATFYIGNDNLERKTNSSIQTYGLGWSNVLGTIRWNHVFNKKLFSNTTAYITRYQYLMYLSKDHRAYWNSEIFNITLKTDFTWFLNPRNTLTAGMSINAHGLDAGNINLDDLNSTDPRDVPKYNCSEYTFYVGNQQKIAKKFTLRYGLRLPIWQDLGPTSVYFFDGNYEVIDTFNADKDAVYYSHASLEPRINITYQLNSHSSLKAGYSRTTQYLNELNNNISPFTSLSVWVPAGPNIEPRKADQYSLGYFTKLFRNRIRFSAETYYKHFYNYIDYAPHANMLYNPLIEGEIRKGEAWSYGLELMLHKSFGKLSGWIGYTYSRIFVKTPEVNHGQEYRAFQDRPHHITFFLSYDTGKRWSFSANWIYMSGAAITSPVSFYDYNGYVVPVYDEKNNDRLPDYHRLDLSASFNLHKNENARFKHKFILNLFNVYGRTNPYFISFSRIQNQNGHYVIPADHSAVNYRIPTALSVSEIIPSINYQFKF
ncbi:MAG: TonB-dependent receptor [Bacteroidota bacterium]